MKRTVLKIGGMTCSACSNSLEKHLNKQEKIEDAVINLVLQTATIYHEDDIPIEKIEQYIEEKGFKSLGIYQHLDIQKSTIQEQKKLIIYGLLLIILMYFSMGDMVGLPTLFMKNEFPKLYTIIVFFLTIPFIFFGKSLLKNGFKNLKNNSPNMESLVSIGITSSLLVSIFQMLKIITNHTTSLNLLYFESVAMIIYFVKLGNFLDKNNKAKTMKAIEELVQMTPEKALLKMKVQEKEVTIDEIKVDDILIAKPGMKIAVDGIIIKGTTHLDETFITGESIPTKKTIGDQVIAGSINYDGVIEYKAEKIGRNSMISEIVHLVVDATNNKVPIMRLVDQISMYFVPTIFIIAFLTLLYQLIVTNSVSIGFQSFVTVLVVACPCALGLATPLAIIVSSGTSAKQGILIKSSEVLENACKVDTILFDKTGTLTKGKMEIVEVITEESKEQILQIAANIEKYSTHPLRQPFLEHETINKKIFKEVEEFQTIDGVGIFAKLDQNSYHLGNHRLFSELKKKNSYEKEEQRLLKNGNTVVYIFENEEVKGLIAIKDNLREESKEVITTLKRMNKQVIMLTGDNKEVANLIAKELELKEFHAEMLPKDKRELIQKLKQQGKKVMMVGDGINDAPSLALADIGISLSSSTDIAMNSANVILLQNDLTKILDFLNISKKTLTTIHQNLFWAFLYNIIMLPIATGVFELHISPAIASITMTLSSLTVVFNSLHLKNKIERKMRDK